eukprot:CAMPEP_0115577050 /NCGR_PEP_ID=MMETSP0272-20121206/2873_1 /TAXON_ID=71861 /ORGANISM="Scrippsiella trochoidea, Strain CCMP3099" /LENGTH=335 /DNA_ID=CAMNT_0003011851 /DNA_START=18 /DNA_END=1022 /DNA_ORIENTATION=+
MYTNGRLPTLLSSRPQAVASPKKSSCRPIPQPLEDHTDQPEACTPPAYVVKNTFIECCARRSPSLEAFFRERKLQTCPSSRVGLLADFCRDQEKAEADFFSHLSSTREPSPSNASLVVATASLQSVGTPSGCRAEAQMAACAGSSSEATAEEEEEVAQSSESGSVPATSVAGDSEPAEAASCSEHGSCPPTSVAVAKTAFSLSDALEALEDRGGEAPSGRLSGRIASDVAVCDSASSAHLPSSTDSAGCMPVIGSSVVMLQVLAGHEAVAQPQLWPSAGSAGHHLGQCTPCAFLHTKGCHAGAAPASTAIVRAGGQEDPEAGEGRAESGRPQSQA